jgi:hypothetical protein
VDDHLGHPYNVFCVVWSFLHQQQHGYISIALGIADDTRLGSVGRHEIHASLSTLACCEG